MPIHDLGYRAWQGRLTSPYTRWLVIAETGARRAWQSTWLRRILLFAWLPTLAFSFAFMAFERAVQDPTWQGGVFEFAQGLDEVNRGFMGAAAEQAAEQAKARGETPVVDPGPAGGPFGELLQPESQTVDGGEVLRANRHLVWTYMLRAFFRYPQGLSLILLVGLIAPPLISEDVQSRAFLFYFSRPLDRLEYFIGKSATVWFYLVSITTAPALFLYLLGVLLSPDTSVVADTWDIPLRVLVASVTLVVPATALALCYSSLTRESRYAGFGWFATWILGGVAWLFISQMNRPFIVQDEGHSFEELFSLYHVFGAVQSWIFGFESFADVRQFVILLATLTVVALAILFHRISAPMRA